MTRGRPEGDSSLRGSDDVVARRQARSRGAEVHTKPPPTHLELVTRMQSRGLAIPEPDRAVRYLRHVGYYRLSPYMIPFQAAPGDHEFRPGTTFDDVLSLYVFDRQLRLLVMALEHYLTRYAAPELPPSWVMVEELTIGQLERTVANLADRTDRTAIAAGLGINDVLMRSWLRTYVRVRNICAHHGRLWNRGLGVYPALPTSRHVAWLSDGQVLTGPRHTYRQRRLYPVLVSIGSILVTISPGSSWRSRLVQLMNRHPHVPLRAMGMPDRWSEDAFWS